MLATSRPSPKASPSLPSTSPFPNLPMFKVITFKQTTSEINFRTILQPSGSTFSSYSTQYAGTSSSLHYSSMEPASPSLFSSTPYESALTYTSSNAVPAPVAPPKSSSYFGGTDIGSSLGARPKSGKLSSSPDDIYHSSDEEDRYWIGMSIY